MTPSARRARRLLAAAAMISAVAQVAACASGHTTASPGATTTAPSSTATAAPSPPLRSMAAAKACANSTLTPSLAVSGAAAGTAYYTLRLTNTSTERCTLYGYPGVSFLSSVPGHQVGIAAKRNPLYSPITVLLAPKATAHAVVGVVAAGNYPASRCRPTTAHVLQIFPPGQTTAVDIHRTFAACAGNVPVLSVTALRLGKGGRIS